LTLAQPWSCGGVSLCAFSSGGLDDDGRFTPSSRQTQFAAMGHNQTSKDQ